MGSNFFDKTFASGTEKNTVILPNFMVWQFYGKAQFPHSFGRIAQNCAFPQNSHTRKLGENAVFFGSMEMSRKIKIFAVISASP